MLNFLTIGIPVMLLCLAIQSALTGVSVQFYLRRI
jgi:hypothetical protein